MPKTTATTETAVPLALEQLAGAALVLDSQLRVVLATPAAELLVGFAIAPGARAAKILCGESTQRPVAEALAAGRPIEAVIPRPQSASTTRMVRVRGLPLGGGGHSGWLLLLSEASPADTAGAMHFHGMWTQDDSMKRLFHVIERVALGDAPVLVRGETGAGKELVANAIHALSPRRTGPFRALNCAALPPNLLESELFGHVKGAFTGAVRDTPGHMQLAHRGTLLLDEIAELPLELQAKLLRVLETHTVLPVGARQPTPVDVRVVSATHRSLRTAVEAGRFRADLMYRLRVIPIFLPPLRARPGDVMLLVQRTIGEFNERGRRRVERVAPAAKTVLESHDWPGNVRELRNALEYAYAIGEGPVLLPTDLPPELADPAFRADASPASPSNRLEPSSVAPEVVRIERALERAAGSRGRAAQILGMSRITLWRHMKALGIDGQGGAARRHLR